MIGIYKITSPSNKIYIGQSASILDRFYYYKLEKHSKNQRKLYNSFRKYGVDNHRFEVIELCTIDKLNERERFWQEYYDCVDNGLNCVYTKNKDKSGYVSNETKERMSKSQKERFKKNKHHLIGTKRSDEVRKKMSKSLTGRKLSKEHIRKLSESHIGKMSGENHPRVKIILNLDYGIFYHGINEAAFSLGVKTTTLNSQLTGRNKLKFNIIVI